jgi:hypothetical protein
MNVIWDIAGSIVIAAIVVLMIVSLNIYSKQTKFGSDQQLQLQNNAITMADILSYDLRKIGYKCDSTKIIDAEPHRLSFYADIDSNGTVDKITYFLGDSTSARGTTNPHDIVFYRVVNNDTIGGPSLGLTKLLFTYKDANGDTTSIISKIKYVRAEM